MEQKSVNDMLLNSKISLFKWKMGRDSKITLTVFLLTTDNRSLLSS